MLIAVSLWAVHSFAADAKQYPAKGLILKVDLQHRTFVASIQAIPGFMDAMTMPFAVADATELEGITPGALVDFTIDVEETGYRAEKLQKRSFQNLENDPLSAKRLGLMNRALDPGGVQLLKVGDRVPDFVLTDQDHRTTRLSQFMGKVVAISFIYTRCPLPNYCFRLSNNFARLQKRFPDHLGRDLVLLSVTFDPAHDSPEALAEYAQTWHADLRGWRFLTGTAADIEKLSQSFGVDFWPDEGLMIHSLHTVLIDRKGRLIANLEGNEFTAEQLGDLVQSTLRAVPSSSHKGRMSQKGLLTER